MILDVNKFRVKHFLHRKFDESYSVSVRKSNQKNWMCDWMSEGRASSERCFPPRKLTYWQIIHLSSYNRVYTVLVPYFTISGTYRINICSIKLISPQRSFISHETNCLWTVVWKQYFNWELLKERKATVIIHLRDTYEIWYHSTRGEQKRKGKS